VLSAHPFDKSAPGKRNCILVPVDPVEALDQPWRKEILRADEHEDEGDSPPERSLPVKQVRVSDGEYQSIQRKQQE
jgi:hypothetical protein